MAKIVGHPQCELDIKRLYLPGVILKDKCPNCHCKQVCDFGDTYLSFPKINKPDIFTMYCDECDHEWDINVIIRLSVEIDK